MNRCAREITQWRQSVKLILAMHVQWDYFDFGCNLLFWCWFVLIVFVVFGFHFDARVVIGSVLFLGCVVLF